MYLCLLSRSLLLFTNPIRHFFRETILRDWWDLTVWPFHKGYRKPALMGLDTSPAPPLKVPKDPVLEQLQPCRDTAICRTLQYRNRGYLVKHPPPHFTNGLYRCWLTNKALLSHMAKYFQGFHWRHTASNIQYIPRLDCITSQRHWLGCSPQTKRERDLISPFMKCTS